jgi:hypothetical protein
VPGSAVYSFTDPEDYQANLVELRMRLVLTARERFSARLSRATLSHLQLLRAEETVPRVARVSLPPDMLCISFPTHSDPPPVWGGEEMRPGNIMFHSRDDSLYQLTHGPSRWGLISFEATLLAGYGRALNDVDLAPPAVGRVLRPLAADQARLLRLHAQVGRLSQTRPAIISHPESPEPSSSN